MTKRLKMIKERRKERMDMVTEKEKDKKKTQGELDWKEE